MAKDFKGHFRPDDIRHPVWAAGGCTWPTVPPYRLRLGSENAPVVWALLETDGVLFQADVDPTHDDITYHAISAMPDFVTDMWLWKHFYPITNAIRWTLFINNDIDPFAWEVTHLFEPMACNQTVVLPNPDWIYPHQESPGHPITLWQVYYDETDPPEGWPPWE